MTAPAGRRERKKAATRANIVDTAMRLFLEHGYDAVGIRDVAAEADVAVTTVFSHFASKEALVFARDESLEQQLVEAVTSRAPDEPLMVALHRQVRTLVRHATADSAAPLWRLVDETPALRSYEESVRLRHAETLAATLAADPHLGRTETACRAIARFVIDAYSLARQAHDPDATVDEIFPLIEAAWEAALAPRGADSRSRSGTT